jgi:Protein of unknown function (DUF664)
MFAAPDQPREFITGLYRRAWAHSDAIDALGLDAIGRVPWWPPDRNAVTLHHVLVRVVAKASQHAGPDIIRELIDGTIGLTVGRPYLPSADKAWWTTYRERVEHAAQEAAKASTAQGADNHGPAGMTGDSP